MWTEGQYQSFIRNNLRRISMRWAPINQVKAEARISRGVYLCNGCKTEGPASIRIDGKKYNNACVDHIDPIIDPNEGFVSWDKFINNLFCEKDKLQVLCHKCHTTKTTAERELSKIAKSGKLND